jgi:arsenite-transporting ATPase
MKYIFFGGKGGVGKTVMAAAAALWSAKQGKKTLLASTNPVHSLSNLLEKDVFGKAAVVCDEEKCYAFEIDTRDTIERSKKEIREKINWFLKFADITTKAEDFIESATMNPAFEESAMFENMVDLMFKDEYDFYVFDTAPTANARRLLGMSKVYSLWVEKMLKSREEAKSLREILSFSKKEKKDPLLDYLLSFKDRMGNAKDLLTDEALTAFFFVTSIGSMNLEFPLAGWSSMESSKRIRWEKMLPNSSATGSRCKMNIWKRSGRSSRIG